MLITTRMSDCDPAVNEAGIGEQVRDLLVDISRRAVREDLRSACRLCGARGRSLDSVANVQQQIELRLQCVDPLGQCRERGGGVSIGLLVPTCGDYANDVADDEARVGTSQTRADILMRRTECDPHD